MKRRRILGSVILLAAIAALGWYLAVWKRGELEKSAAAAAAQPEPMEVVTAEAARERDFQRTTVSIGTVMALRSVMLRNELAGTVREVHLEPGKIVEEGTVLVALDVAVEEAEARALQAQVKLAETMYSRMQRALENKGASATDVDRTKSERDVLLANVARAEAIIARKTIKAPFRAHVGLSNVHVGQYLNEGSTITTLEGINEAAHVDFSVTQDVAARLKPDDRVQVIASSAEAPVEARVVATDARVDQATRNALVRARIEGTAAKALSPGAAVRVRVPVGPSRKTVVVPVNALRKGPGGDHVFVIQADEKGAQRAHQRAVQSGAILGDEVVIEGGVKIGEVVAASGSFKLREGVLVIVKDESAARAH